MKVSNMKVSNMESPKTEHSVLNQFIITITEYWNDCGIENDVEYFQSYKSIIVKRTWRVNKWFVELDKNYWDYSKTTGKYRNIFLGETKKETEKKIKSGEYILTNLN